MKKAFQISLAGTLFTMEDDAYAKLDGYLSSIKSHFSKTEGRDEIVKDIEARIAEKLLEAGKPIVTIDEVESVIESMGKVEDFGDGIKEETSAKDVRSKKLYRNPDDTVVAGVCSGLGKYFGIDPLWIRLFFVLATIFLNGFPILVYVILWIVTPEAKTAAQKLEMEGTPVTLETLSENVKEKVEEIDQKHGTTLRRVISFPFLVLKKIVLFIKRVIFPLIKGIIAVVLAAGSLALILGLSFAGPYLLASPERIADFPITEAIPGFVFGIAVVSAYLILAIPAVFVFLLALSVFRKKSPVNARLGYSLLGIWLIALMALGSSTAVSVSAFQDYARTSPRFETITREIPLAGEIQNLSVAHGQKIRLVQGSNTELVATGRDVDIARLSVAVTDGTLSVRRSSNGDICIFCLGRAPEITLTLPVLSKIAIQHGSRLESEKWDATEPLSIEVRHGSRLDMNLIGPETKAVVEHGSRLDLEGASEKADFEARHGSRIQAEMFSTKHSRSAAEFGSQIMLQSTLTLDAEARHGSSVRYSGNPQVTEKSEYGSEIRSAETD
jgi:phage shock protein PspC (stress-responsive transcriptional regulator)